MIDILLHVCYGIYILERRVRIYALIGESRRMGFILDALVYLNRISQESLVSLNRISPGIAG
jgi:hypothetical protein